MSTTPVAVRVALLAAGDRPLLLDLSGHSRNGGELARLAACVAGALGTVCRPRPKVGLWYRNSFAAVEAFLGVEWSGGTRIPVDPSASSAEAESIFAAAQVDIVLTDVERGGRLRREGLVHDDLRPIAAQPRLTIADYVADDAFMVYPRSVTNGKLFGIPMSYRNWYATVDTSIDLYRSGRYGRWGEASEVFLTAQQLMHGAGCLGAFPFLAMGLPQVIVDAFEAGAVLDAIERHRVTATMFVPAMLNSVVDLLDSRPNAAASLRHVLYGGGPVSGQQIRSAVERIGPALNQVYGRVEGGWPIAILNAADHAAMMGDRPELARSCGRPISEVQVKLRPLAGQPLESGELRVQSAMTSSDYIDTDGWCSLGDVMRVDRDGYLYYEKRVDRMINTGYHVYPDEVEAVIATVEGVGSVLVRGESHPKWGQALVAYVVANTAVASEALIRDIEAALHDRLARYKIPRDIKVVAVLPSLGTAPEVLQ
ncbi:MAG: fatty acid--CoA ligase family protein [Caldimonas sp.]